HAIHPQVLARCAPHRARGGDRRRDPRIHHPARERRRTHRGAVRILRDPRDHPRDRPRLGAQLHGVAEARRRARTGRRVTVRLMPRRIDAGERTAEIAAAALRVLERDGLPGLSVRGVAAEAGIAAASLRRAFPTQHALREYCLELIEERARIRIAALGLTGRPLADALLAQLLSLDDERRTELVALLPIGVLALTCLDLRPVTVWTS